MAFEMPVPSEATTYTLPNAQLPAGTWPANLEFIPRNRRCWKHQSCSKPERNAGGVSRGGKGGAPPKAQERMLKAQHIAAEPQSLA